MRRDNRGDSPVFGELQLQLHGVRVRTVARGAFSAARSTEMEPWHATTSSDHSANHRAYLPDERYDHAPLPRRPQQRGVDNARTPNLTTERGGQNVQQGQHKKDCSLHTGFTGVFLESIYDILTSRHCWRWKCLKISF